MEIVGIIATRKRARRVFERAPTSHAEEAFN